MEDVIQDKSTKQQVLDAVALLCEKEGFAVREEIAKHTGLKLSIVDDRLKVLIDDDDVLRLQRGIFIMAKKFNPPRLISKTVLPDGVTVLEIGDVVLHLTPREVCCLGKMLVGDVL